MSTIKLDSVSIEEPGWLDPPMTLFQKDIGSKHTLTIPKKTKLRPDKFTVAPNKTVVAEVVMTKIFNSATFTQTQVRSAFHQAVRSLAKIFRHVWLPLVHILARYFQCRC